MIRSPAWLSNNRRPCDHPYSVTQKTPRLEPSRPSSSQSERQLGPRPERRERDRGPDSASDLPNGSLANWRFVIYNVHRWLVFGCRLQSRGGSNAQSPARTPPTTGEVWLCIAHHAAPGIRTIAGSVANAVASCAPRLVLPRPTDGETPPRASEGVVHNPAEAAFVSLPSWQASSSRWARWPWGSLSYAFHSAASGRGLLRHRPMSSVPPLCQSRACRSGPRRRCYRRPVPPNRSRVPPRLRQLRPLHQGQRSRPHHARRLLRHNAFSNWYTEAAHHTPNHWAR